MLRDGDKLAERVFLAVMLVWLAIGVWTFWIAPARSELYVDTLFRPDVVEDYGYKKCMQTQFNLPTPITRIRICIWENDT